MEPLTTQQSVQPGDLIRRLVAAALDVAAREDWTREDGAQAHTAFQAALIDYMAQRAPAVKVQPYKTHLRFADLDMAYDRILLAALHLAFIKRDDVDTETVEHNYRRLEQSLQEYAREAEDAVRPGWSW